MRPDIGAALSTEVEQSYERLGYETPTELVRDATRRLMEWGRNPLTHGSVSVESPHISMVGDEDGVLHVSCKRCDRSMSIEEMTDRNDLWRLSPGELVYNFFDTKGFEVRSEFRDRIVSGAAIRDEIPDSEYLQEQLVRCDSGVSSTADARLITDVYEVVAENYTKSRRRRRDEIHEAVERKLLEGGTDGLVERLKSAGVDPDSFEEVQFDDILTRIIYNTNRSSYSVYIDLDPEEVADKKVDEIIGVIKSAVEEQTVD